MRDILAIGRRHLAEHGAAALSLRAVARDLGVVSSAVYRYVPSRDDLLTMLIVDAYDGLGSAVDEAIADAGSAVDDAMADAGGARGAGGLGGDSEAASTNPVDRRSDPALNAARFRALAWAVRSWALANSASYGLIFGGPVPGYATPPESTIGPGTRVVTRLLEICASDEAAGPGQDDATGSSGERGVSRPGLVPSDPANRGVVAGVLGAFAEREGLELSPERLVVGARVWSGLFGAVSFEVFGQFGSVPEEFGARLFARHIDSWVAELRLRTVAR